MAETTYVRPYIAELDDNPMTTALKYEQVDYVDALGDIHLADQSTSARGNARRHAGSIHN